jgi:AmpE protein
VKFLVILLALVLTATWLRDADRFDDSWFGRYQRAIRKLAGKADGGGRYPIAAVLGAIYGVLIAIIIILGSLAEGAFYGLATMLLHLVVLLFAMDRTQPGRLVRDFLRSWNAGDRQGCINYLETELRLESAPRTEDGAVIVAQFKRLLAYRSFERMFMMYTLYIVAGPAGVIFGYVSYQLRAELCEEADRSLAEHLERIIAVIEWVPLRLLAITFSLVGDFNSCVSHLRRHLWEFKAASDNAQLLADWARCALSEPAAGEAKGDGFDEAAMSLEIEALSGLLERSQIVWLVVVAVVTLIGV